MFTTRAGSVSSSVAHSAPTTSRRTRARRSPSAIIAAPRERSRRFDSVLRLLSASARASRTIPSHAAAREHASRRRSGSGPAPGSPSTTARSRDAMVFACWAVVSCINSPISPSANMPARSDGLICPRIPATHRWVEPGDSTASRISSTTAVTGTPARRPLAPSAPSLRGTRASPIAGRVRDGGTRKRRAPTHSAHLRRRSRRRDRAA